MAWEKKATQTEAVKAFLVTVSGKVDIDQSVEKYRQAAVRHVAKQESDEALITICLTSLFDQFKGANLGLEYIKSQVVERMGKTVPDLKDPNLFSFLAARVEEVLHDNCDQPAVEAKGNKPAMEAVTGRTYAMKKGAGGGFYRKSDRPASA